jgi:uncharacterized damage-inducible protein DinB
MKSTMQETQVMIPAEALLKHWQGHRDLTRRVIDAFPEDKLFSYSIGGMRTFADLALEMLDIAEEGIIGMATDKWIAMSDFKHISSIGKPRTKAELLQQWDKATEDINKYWPQITAERFHETAMVFGQFEQTVYEALCYFIDNENHHRGQGYVHLRALGIEPPFFWER